MKKITLVILIFSSIILSSSCKNGKKSKSTNKFNTQQTISPEISSELLMAAKDGDLTNVKRYIDMGVDPNYANEDGFNSLMFASYNGYVEIMKVLINAGALVNVQNTAGRTPLMFASSGPFPEAVKYLIDQGANLDLIDSDQHFTALMFAGAEGQLEVVKILLEAGANPYMTEVDNDTAESFAAANGHTEVVNYIKKFEKSHKKSEYNK